MPSPRSIDEVVALVTRAVGRILCVALVFVWAALPPTCMAAPAQVEVSVTQNVTLVGEWASLRTVIEDLCYRAGVELLAYDATDRRVAADYSDRPLYDVLPRLLREESFALGLRAESTDGQPSVGWLRVMGDNEAARHNRTPLAGKSYAQGFQLPPALVRSAFSSRDPQERQQALTLLTDRILGNERQLEGFLATEPEMIAEAVRRYPAAESILSSLVDQQEDGELRDKLAEVVAALRE